MEWGRALIGWVGSTLDELEDVNWPLVLLALFAAVQYLYVHVSYEIAALPRLIVFVLVGGAPPV